MNNTKKTNTPHKHADLIKEWADHLEAGKVADGWYKVQVYTSNNWVTIYEPSWSYDKYRVVMTDKHPEFTSKQTLENKHD